LNRRVEELKLAVKQRKHIRYTIYQIYTCKETKAVRVKQKAIKQRRERLLSELATIQSQRRSPSLKLNEYEDKRQRMGSLLVQTSQSQSILLGELFKIYGFQLCDIVLPTTDPMPSPTYRFLTFNPVSIKYQTPELRVQTNAILMQLARLIELISRYLDQDLPFNFQLRPNGHLYLTTGYAVDSFALPLFATSRRPFVWFELSLVFLSYSLASLCWRLGNCGTSTTNVGVFDWLHAALLQTTKQPRE
jgi:hypothetical protein